jgi:hypothetical protein
MNTLAEVSIPLLMMMIITMYGLWTYAKIQYIPLVNMSEVGKSVQLILCLLFRWNDKIAKAFWENVPDVQADVQAHETEEQHMKV